MESEPSITHYLNSKDLYGKKPRQFELRNGSIVIRPHLLLGGPPLPPHSQFRAETRIVLGGEREMNPREKTGEPFEKGRGNTERHKRVSLSHLFSWTKELEDV